MHIARVECSGIPDNAIALAADFRTGKLLVHFFSDEMVFVPELYGTWV